MLREAVRQGKSKQCIPQVPSYLTRNSLRSRLASWNNAEESMKMREGRVESIERESVTRAISVRGHVGKKVLMVSTPQGSNSQQQSGRLHLSWYLSQEGNQSTPLYDGGLLKGTGTSHEASQRSAQRATTLSPYSAQVPITPQPLPSYLDRRSPGAF